MERKFEDLTVDQEMSIFDKLEENQFSPIQTARYIRNITNTAKEYKLSVYMIFQVQIKWALAESRDFIARVSK